MAFPGFTPADFKVFEIDGFGPRMEAIKTRIRPKLEAMGRDLLPDVGRIAGDQAFAHVAKHARRTVNAPDEAPAAVLADMSSDEVARLGDELVRTRHGQIVLGRVVPAQEAARWK